MTVVGKHKPREGGGCHGGKERGGKGGRRMPGWEEGKGGREENTPWRRMGNYQLYIVVCSA